MRISMTRALGICACALALGACQEEIGTISSAHMGGEDAGQPPPQDAGPPPPEDAGLEGCTLTQGYWKNHPEKWPVTSLELGGRTYSQADLLTILNTPTRGDASLILAKQLIAAKLNVLAGASSSDAIADADAWLDANDDSSAIPLGIRTNTAAGADAVDIASELADYNEGTEGPGHCDDD